MYLDVSCQMGYRLKDQDTYRIHASSGTGSSSSSVHVRTLGDTVIAITLHKLNSWPECPRNQEEEVTHRTINDMAVDALLLPSAVGRRADREQ